MEFGKLSKWDAVLGVNAISSGSSRENPLRDNNGRVNIFHFNDDATTGCPRGAVCIEVNLGDKPDGHIDNPDIIIAFDDVPRLILALQWMIAGPLGRKAIEKEECDGVR